ncbi:MAG: aminoglycoside phosphotransferase family protein [Clostridia bacterium]|nr:aminoglycoside phosphotransferase family protein [Clostridia bacterium]
METIIRKYFKHGVYNLKAFENVPNNSVYSFESGGEEYIFKLFRSKYWPENDKLQFVNQTLQQHGIPCAELIVFTRDDPAYPDGYLIERKLDGITADKVTFTQEEEAAFYRKLAGIVSAFHSIPVKGFGYLGDGLGGGEESMGAFFDGEFDERVESLEEKGVYTADELRNMKDILMNTFRRFDDLPPVLCHGDLSTKNVMVQDSGALVLIDWDDAMGYNWMADISRFTFWMKMTCGEPEYHLFREAFLEGYHGARKDEFDVFEKAYHIYNALDNLVYAMDVGDEKVAAFTNEYLKQFV